MNINKKDIKYLRKIFEPIFSHTFLKEENISINKKEKYFSIILKKDFDNLEIQIPKYALYRFIFTYVNIDDNNTIRGIKNNFNKNNILTTGSTAPNWVDEVIANSTQVYNEMWKPYIVDKMISILPNEVQNKFNDFKNDLSLAQNKEIFYYSKKINLLDFVVIMFCRTFTDALKYEEKCTPYVLTVLTEIFDFMSESFNDISDLIEKSDKINKLANKIDIYSIRKNI